MGTALANLHQDLRDLVGRTIADRYRVDALLGSGGMGAVFRGHHLGLERDVAIKVLHPSLGRDPEISERFDREARSASRLDHPNCVSVTDYGSTEDDMKFMVMQLLEGGELGRLLGKPLAPLRAIELVLQIVRALEHAHAQGVVHRDIKPENVFITSDHAGNEVLKLVDFGIAKIMSTEGNKRMTRVGLVFGTPAYMSPEQAAGIEADERADIYSAGVMLYEMLAGKPPFDSPDPVSLVRMQITADPPPLPSDVPPVLAACVERLLAKNRIERFQSAIEVREVLEGVHAMLRGDTSAPIVLPMALTSSMEVTTSSTSIAPSQTLDRLVPAAARARPVRRVAALAGVGLLGGLLWVTFAGERVDSEVAADTAAAATEADTEASGAPLAVAMPDAGSLAEIDRLLQSGELDGAEALLLALRDRHPKHAQLSWRWGRLLAKRKNKKAQALAAYGHALESEVALLEDPNFYAEIHDLMQIPALRDEGLDLALRLMGTRGHTFLLDLVNNEKKPLAYEQRQRALEELSTDTASWALVNRRLNIALDVLQAKQALHPCQAYDEALTNVSAMPDFWFYSRVAHSDVPTVDASAKNPSEDPVLCATLPQRKIDTLELLSALAPAGTELAPPAEPVEPAAKSAGSTKSRTSTKPSTSTRPTSGPGPAKSSKPKSSAKKVDCNKFRGIFKKQCW